MGNGSHRLTFEYLVPVGRTLWKEKLLEEVCYRWAFRLHTVPSRLLPVCRSDSSSPLLLRHHACRPAAMLPASDHDGLFSLWNLPPQYILPSLRSTLP